MKKINMLLFILISFNSCKEDKKDFKRYNQISIQELKSSKKNNILKEINKIINNDNLTREDFKSLVLPSIIKLEKIDNKKTKIITVIAKKISKETNIEAFKLGINNFKEELKKQNNI